MAFVTGISVSLTREVPAHLLKLPLRVLVADGCEGFDRQIRNRLERDKRFAVCAHATSASEAVEAVATTKPHIVLLGVELAGGGVRAAREMLARWPELTLVIFADDGAALFSALRVGADGYLLRSMNLDRLPNTLWGAVTGSEVALPHALFHQILSRFRDPAALRRPTVTMDGNQLTSREWQILSLVRAGTSSRQIAQQLSISMATVRSHRRRIRQKLASNTS